MNQPTHSNKAAFLFEVGRPQKLNNGAQSIALRGHMDADGAPQLSELLVQLLEAGTTKVRLDFSEVKFISSTGIGTLIAAIGEYRQAGGDLILDKLPVEIREVFEMLDLMDYVTIG